MTLQDGNIRQAEPRQVVRDADSRDSSTADDNLGVGGETQFSRSRPDCIELNRIGGVLLLPELPVPCR